MSSLGPITGIQVDSLPPRCQGFGQRILRDWNSKNYTDVHTITPPIAEEILNFFPPNEYIDLNDYDRLFKYYFYTDTRNPLITPEQFGSCFEYLRSRKGFENLPPFKNEYGLMTWFVDLRTPERPIASPVEVPVSAFDVQLAEAQIVVEEMFDQAIVGDSDGSYDLKEKQACVDELKKLFMVLLRLSPFPLNIAALKEVSEFINGNPEASFDQKATDVVMARDKLFLTYPEIKEEYDGIFAFFERCPEWKKLRESLTVNLLYALSMYWEIYFLWDLGLRENLELI